MNYDELVVYNNDAARPSYLVMYEGVASEDGRDATRPRIPSGITPSPDSQGSPNPGSGLFKASSTPSKPITLQKFKTAASLLDKTTYTADDCPHGV